MMDRMEQMMDRMELMMNKMERMEYRRKHVEVRMKQLEHRMQQVAEKDSSTQMLLSDAKVCTCLDRAYVYQTFLTASEFHIFFFKFAFGSIYVLVLY